METTFPYRLYQVLELMDKKAPSESAIRWGPDGKSFRVQLKQEFCQEIIPKFFESKRLLIDNDFLKLMVFRFHSEQIHELYPTIKYLRF
jgi:hypothetical protein